MGFPKFLKKRIFLDYAAGANNPTAIYKEGLEARAMLEKARTKLARLMHVQTRDIIFTSGGTESDNLALLGTWRPGGHIIVSSIEHPAVLECAREIERRGGEVTYVDAVEGFVQPQDVVKAVKGNTTLVSIMLASNETGNIQPVSKIARLVKEKNKNILIHTDASAAAGYHHLDVSKLGVDLMTVENVLVVRSHVDLKPIMFGGGQERGLRPGTPRVSDIVDFAEYLQNPPKAAQIKDFFVSEITKEFPNAVVNTKEPSLLHIVSVSFPGRLHEFLAIQFDEAGIAASTGSSCKSNKKIDEGEALRFSFGPQTSIKEIKKVISVLRQIVI